MSRDRSLSGWLTRNLGILLMIALTGGAIACLLLIASELEDSNERRIILASVALVVVAMGIVALLLAPDALRSQATNRTLRMVSSTLDHMSGGLNEQNCQATCEVLLPETGAMAIAMTNRTHVLAYVGEGQADYPPGSPIRTQVTQQVIETGEPQRFVNRGPESMVPAEGQDIPVYVPAGIVVPLNVRDKTVGAIKFYYRNRRDIDRTQEAIVYGLGQLVSTELSTYELDRQAELTARAEVKALQAQINPHFLFNTLNTIAAFTRTDPGRARDLLREFAVFYRQTLENSETTIPVSREIEQTKRYLTFEQARFGEDRIVERESIEPGCEDVGVPSFIVQPLVENAVRHAMRDEGALHIDIHVATDGADVLIAVTDDGLGMDESDAQALRAGARPAGDASEGAGVALRNVAERIERFYGIGSGIEILSKPGEGTSVTLRLAEAAPRVENDQG